MNPLPINQLSEDRIERAVESRINGIDRDFMDGYFTQGEYDSRINSIRLWADRQFDTLAALNRAKRKMGV